MSRVITETGSFLAAAEAFVELVGRLPADLTGPGLGVWDLRALVGHTSRAMITVSTYLAQPAETIALESAVAYVAMVADLSTDDAAVAERGVQAGAALGDDPAGACGRLLATVTDDLAGADAEQLVTTIGGGMRLRDYLPTRTFELVVHGLDIAAAAGVDWRPRFEAMDEACVLAARVAVRRGEGPRFLRAVTGREGSPYSIV